MQGGRLCNGEARATGRSVRLSLSVLLLVPLLSGCLPGLKWGDDDADNGPAPVSSEGEPALNRSYKSDFLASGAQNLQGQLIPGIASDVWSAFSTIERRSAGTGAGGLFGTGTETGAAFEPALLPPAASLANFYSALAKLASKQRSQPVAILHLGDDHIAHDHFAGALREHLTGRFGAAGRGVMMPGLYPIRGMKTDRRGRWSLASAAAGAEGPFGITGVRMTSASPDAWLRFSSGQGTFDWAEVTFMTGPGFGTALVSVDNDTKSVPTGALTANETAIRISTRAHEVVIRPGGDGPISVLSVATGTDTPGIAYSNLGLPGAAASTLGKWTADFAANDLRRLNPDLILLQYGTREGFDDSLDVGQYETQARENIERIKQWAPQASVLVAGPPDAARLPAFSGSAGAQICRALSAHEVANYRAMIERSDERLAHWHAPPRLEAVGAALRRAAAATGSFYWDWTKYMGGPCAIHSWATLTPPLAAPDHKTLTEAGDSRSARALFAELMAGYDAYQRAARAKAPAFLTTTEVKPVPPAKKRHAKTP